jgi:RimJ/RimL family protein N-acetyltransferase
MRDQFRSPVFETERLELRTLQAGDEDFLAKLDSDPEVMKYIHAGALTQKSAMHWAKLQVETAPHKWYFTKWMIELQVTGVPIGWVELFKFRGEFDPDEDNMSDDISIGYQFAPEFWGRGFAVEALRPVLTYALGELELPRVVAFVRKENTRSVGVLEKLGFRQQANVPYQDEGGRDCLLLSVVPADLRQY